MPLIRAESILVFLLLSLVPMKVIAMDLDLRAPEAEIQIALQRALSKDASRDAVLVFARNEFRVRKEDIYSHDYGDIPLKTVISDKEITAYYWIRLELGEYRSLASLFLIRTSVIAALYFDKEQRLLGIKVTKFHDAL